MCRVGSSRLAVARVEECWSIHPRDGSLLFFFWLPISKPDSSHTTHAHTNTHAQPHLRSVQPATTPDHRPPSEQAHDSPKKQQDTEKRPTLYWTGSYPPTGGISCGMMGYSSVRPSALAGGDFDGTDGVDSDLLNRGFLAISGRVRRSFVVCGEERFVVVAGVQGRSVNWAGLEMRASRLDVESSSVDYVRFQGW